MRGNAIGTLALATVLILSGCGDDGSSTDGAPPATTATAAPATTSSPYGAPEIDPPAPGEPILIVSGGAVPLELTMEDLDALGRTTVTVDEPFVKKRQTFSGVPLATVLAEAGIPASATINTVALNDYEYTSEAQPMITSDALLATQRDGAPIPYDQGGPVRLVFPDGTPLSRVLDAWNWSLASISVVSSGSEGT